jgi:hypothetical protein
MVQAYMELGPLFLEHVAALRNHSGLPAAVLTLAGIMYNYTDERYIRLVDAPEFLALLRCIASLTRRCPLHVPLLPCVQSCHVQSCVSTASSRCIDSPTRMSASSKWWTS